MERFCFCRSRIRSLTLSSTVESIGYCAFISCDKLVYADFSAAHGLRLIEDSAFSSCEALRHVQLNDGLETIGSRCFEKSGLWEVTIPGSVKSIDHNAFEGSFYLKQARFLGATEIGHTDPESTTGRFSDDAEEGSQ